MAYTGTGLVVREAAPPLAPGLSGFFDKDLPNFFKKGLRYTGAVIVSPFVTARTSRKIFGLSPRESSQFETGAKVTRGIAAAAAAAAGGYALFGPAAAPAAGAGAASSATAATFPLSTGFSLTTQAVPAGFAAAAPAGAGAAGVTGSVAAGTSIFGKVAAGFSLKGLGYFIGAATILPKLFRGQAAPTVLGFDQGYREATGQSFPVSDVLGFAERVASSARPAPAAAVPSGAVYAAPAEPPQVLEAGTNWLLAAAALGVGLVVLRGGRK